jgi:hypothetical protein
LNQVDIQLFGGIRSPLLAQRLAREVVAQAVLALRLPAIAFDLLLLASIAGGDFVLVHGHVERAQGPGWQNASKRGRVSRSAPRFLTRVLGDLRLYLPTSFSGTVFTWLSWRRTPWVLYLGGEALSGALRALQLSMADAQLLYHDQTLSSER